MITERINAKARIEKLKDLLNKQNELYFDKSSQNNISDSLYDQLLNELKELEQLYPEYKTADSPTMNIGETVNTFNKVKHKNPLLSLDKVLTFDTMIEWLKKMINKSVHDFVFEYKFDGLANSLIYENGELVQGATRGNGTVGKDNTVTAKLIPNVPNSIPKNFKYKEIFNYDTVDVRGEIVLLKEGFDKINATLPDKLKYQNVRNAASGILGNIKPNKSYIQYLRFMPYGLYLDGELVEDYSYSAKIINELFKNKYTAITSEHFDRLTQNDIDKLNTIFSDISDKRDSIPFDIDGIVIKSNSYSDWKRLGIGKKYPNYAVAYKFPAMEQITVLEDVEWLLGGKGTITPRARIKPVEIGGTTVTNPTLHNMDIIKSLDLKIGDCVVVSRHGDVIPEIDRVIFELRTGNEKEIVPPTVCPVCGKELTEKGSFLRCDNVYCEGRKTAKIENFINAMEIDNFGSALIEKLYTANKINVFTDIYSLTKSDIAMLDGMGDKSAEKIISNINKSKANTLDKIIAGLMIPNVSTEKGKILMDEFGTLDKFANCQYSDLIVLPSFGNVIVDNVLDWLAVAEHKELINKLIELNIVGSKPENKSGALNGKSFCFTGKLSVSRTTMEQIIVDNGGVVSSIKKGTDYLIIGEGAKEHKIEKAEGYGIEVITENEFNKLIG